MDHHFVTLKRVRVFKGNQALRTVYLRIPHRPVEEHHRRTDQSASVPCGYLQLFGALSIGVSHHRFVQV